MESYNVHRAAPPPQRHQQQQQQQPRQAYIDMTSPSPSPSSTPIQPSASVVNHYSQSSYRSHGSSIYHSNSSSSHGSSQSSYAPSDPLRASGVVNRRMDPLDFGSFGASIAKSKPSKSSSSAYNNYIKPATPGAFRQGDGARPHQTFSKPSHQPAFAHAQSGYGNGDWPAWVKTGQANPITHARPHPTAVAKPKPMNEDDDVDREDFNLNAAQFTAEDYQRYNGDADKHMQELLSGAIGDGEGEMGDEGMKEGEDVVEGFADGIKLMPHQVRGVKWMKNRETGRKYGGILADDMGLGKTVQTLARIVEGKATPAERKAGHKGGTLIIAPLAVMEQWATECRTKTKPGQLKVTTHHGPSRTKSGKALEGFDVVITTFNTLSSEHGTYEARAQSRVDDEGSDSEPEGGRKKKPVKKKAALCALFEVKWLRVVIDEAQNIKNRNTKSAKAATALRSKYRWCLTGTPIQNNVEELFSLFHFLRAKPLDDWQIFKERISSLVKEGQTKMAMKRLHIVLKAIMLRRTKDAKIDGKAILNLPGRTVEIVPCLFDAEETAFYSALEKKTELSFNKFMAAGTVMNNYTSVLTLLLRLRQACVHPALVTKSLSIDVDAISDDSSSQKKDGAEKAKVVEEADELADLLGGLGVEGGKTCQMCFVKLEVQSATHCAACTKITEKARSKTEEDEDGLPPTSAKIRMLLKLLKDIDDRSESKQKTIVFSQFTSFLDLVEPFLKKQGVTYVRYDGSMKNDKRVEALDKIKNHAATRLILISFKAGSTGLNLTCCNNVILMDLWWNPALEDQAFDRAHRLGQKLDVNIYKLTIAETVEDRILTLQNNKRELANAALSGNGAKGLMKLTMNDIMKLFQRSAKRDDESDDDDDDDE